MIRADAQSLSDLYEDDETAWLDAMAELVRLGRHAELDYAHLAEYLEAMAGRERREVEPARHPARSRPEVATPVREANPELAGDDR